MKKEQSGRISLIFSLSRGYRWLFVISVLSSILAIVFNFLLPQVIRVTVDSVLGDEPFSLPGFLVSVLEHAGGRVFLQNNLIACAIAAMACAVLSGLFNYISRLSMAEASEGMIQRLRNRLFAHIQRLPYKWHVSHQTGDIIQRCTSDVDVIRSVLSVQLSEMIRTVFLIVLAMTLMFSMNIRLSLIALIFLPVILIYSAVFYSKISSRFQSADEAEGRLSSAVQENCTGVRVVRAFGREKYEIDRFDEKNNAFARLWIRLGYLLTYYWGIGDLVSNLQVLVIILAGIWEAVNGDLSVGSFLAFVTYNSMLIWPVRSMGRILSELSKAGVSLERLSEILAAQEEKDPPDALTPPMDKDIVFEHVTFGYDAAKPVLNDVSFCIKAGMTLGILGGTGSGKSTLTYLLDRLYDLSPENGKITIGGVDLQNIRREWVRKNIGLVLQEPFLYSKTIKENIGITSNAEEEMEKIHYNAGIASIDSDIAGFSQGYDTLVGERGVTLSGGQKQRVAIARALMQNAPVLIFDDSLSAVDAETDSKIRSALRTNTQNRTVILISHRITTLMHADHIIVLDGGKIVQSGSHESLSVQDGIYRQIYEMQGTLENELAELSSLERGNSDERL